jgi:hypothetical protein
MGKTFHSDIPIPKSRLLYVVGNSSAAELLTSSSLTILRRGIDEVRLSWAGSDGGGTKMFNGKCRGNPMVGRHEKGKFPE